MASYAPRQQFQVTSRIRSSLLLSDDLHNQLRPLMPAPVRTYVPLIAIGEQRPSGARDGPARRLHLDCQAALRCERRRAAPKSAPMARPGGEPITRKYTQACGAQDQVSKGSIRPGPYSQLLPLASTAPPRS